MSVTSLTMTEVEAETEAEVEGGGEQLNNQQLLVNNATPVVPTIVTTTPRRSSAGSSHNGQVSSTIPASVQSSKARTRQNQLIGSIEASSNATSNAFDTLLQQRQLLEEYEWRQRRLDREEERARQEEDRLRREEEMHEMRQKESRQQEQLSTLMQMALTGMMAYFGMQKPPEGGK
jgi:hypothetical protein